MGYGKKRKLAKKIPVHNEELDFEKRPRFSVGHDHNPKRGKVRKLLPIKATGGKIIHQQTYEKVDKEEEDSEDEEIETENVEEQIEVEEPKSMEQLISIRKKLIQEKKAVITHVASEVIADPQRNYRMMKQLRMLLDDKTNPESMATIRKLATASLSSLFVDIIPGYRIRERTAQEKAVKLSKEVKALTEFEEGLLIQYKHFLQCLEKMIKQRQRPGKSTLMSAESFSSVGEIAIHAMADLYMNTSHFNYHGNITLFFVPIANNDSDPAVRKVCCDAIVSMFGTDKKGEQSLATVTAIAGVAKERGPRTLKPEFLKTLFNLRIKTVDYSMIGQEKSKEARKKIKEAKKKMSKREKREMKKRKELDSELKEVAATEDQDERIRINTEIVQQIFLIYFRILKHKDGEMQDCRNILPTVLEGLAQYAHLINIEFFGDLFNVLEQLISGGKLTCRENLHCIYTVFQILSGQGEVLNIDPVHFYTILYNIIPELCAEQHNDNIKLMIDCVDVMLNKRRKQVTMTTLCAFIKRLLALVLQLQSSQQVVDVLEEIGKLINSNSKTKALFDIDSMSLGNYDPLIEDPTHSKAHSSVLWEKHLLRRHYVPLVGQVANRTIRETPK